MAMAIARLLPTSTTNRLARVNEGEINYCVYLSEEVVGWNNPVV
jgi:hypothetical protein